MAGAEAQVTVRHMERSDIEAVIALQNRVYPGIGGWRPEQIASQLEMFPAGQVVACLKGKVVGIASSLIVRWDDWGERHTWRAVTGHGTFETHSPGGRTLYGAEVCTDPEVRRRGIGRMLYKARRTICQALNLRRIMACGRMPGYHRVSAQMTPEEYAMRVIWGDFADPVLMFQLREGFRYCGVAHDYLPSDKDSCGHATIIVWLNDRYRPEIPTRIPEGPIV